MTTIKQTNLMTTLPIALQLYTLRDALAADVAGTLERVAAIGYAGVETAGFAGTTATAVGRLCRELGLAIAGAHMPLPLGADQAAVLADMAALGTTRLVNGWQPPEQYATADAIRRTADRFNEAAVVAGENGLTFGVHNHWWEFEPVAGRPAYQILLEHLDPAVYLEIDTYWVAVAGADPAAVLAELGPRAPLLHLKDGPGRQDAPMVALGQGMMDFPAVLRASHADWLIVELDRCATDMMTAVADSYAYLVGEGLGHGREG